MDDIDVHIGNAIKCGWRGEVLAAYVVSGVTIEDIDGLDAALDRAVAQSPSGKLALMNFVQPGVPIPSGRVRFRLIKFFRKRKFHAFGMVPTLPGTSLWVRLARQFIKLMLIIVRPPFRVKVSSTVDETLDQMEVILRDRSSIGTKLSRTELEQFAEQVAEKVEVDLLKKLRDAG